MSYDDFIHLIERIFLVPCLGCPIIYGASANAASWWDNREVAYLGWQPKDSAEAFRDKLDAEMDPPPADDVNAVFQGGALLRRRHPRRDSGLTRSRCKSCRGNETNLDRFSKT